MRDTQLGIVYWYIGTWYMYEYMYMYFYIFIFGMFHSDHSGLLFIVCASFVADLANTLPHTLNTTAPKARHAVVA